MPNDPGGGAPGKLTSPSRRRKKVEHVREVLGVSEHRACSVLGQPRSTQRRIARTAEDEERLTADIVELATTYGRYGYRRITALLRESGWLVNRKRVERIWRREGVRRERATGPSAAPNSAEKTTEEGPALAQ